MSNTLEIKNLSKYYKDFKLDHISLNIPSGMVMGLIGENGAGKSTLINSKSSFNPSLFLARLRKEKEHRLNH